MLAISVSPVIPIVEFERKYKQGLAQAVEQLKVKVSLPKGERRLADVIINFASTRARLAFQPCVSKPGWQTYLRRGEFQ